MRGVGPRSRSHSNQTSGAMRRWRHSWPGVTRSARKRARHGRLVPLRHVITPPRARGLRGRERDGRHRRNARCQDATRPRTAEPDQGIGRDERGRAQKDLQVRRDPQRIRQLGAMQRAAQRGVVAELGIAQDGGHGDPAGAHLPQQRQREAPFLLKLHRRPECAHGAVGRAVNQASGRYRLAPTIHARVPVHSAAVTATWQLAILPSVPQYWRATPTECVPCFGKLVPSRISTPSRSGIVARKRRHIGAAVHGASVMKC